MLTLDIVKLLGFTMAFLAIAGIAMVYIRRQEIIDNWDQERCRPYILPISGWIKADDGKTAGQSTKDNFVECSKGIFAAVFAVILEPVYGIFRKIGEALKNLSSITNWFREFMAKIRGFIEKIFRGLFSRMGTLLTQLMVMFSKLRNIMQRSASMTNVLVYMLLSGVSQAIAGYNLGRTIVKVVVALAAALAFILGLFFPPVLAFVIGLAAAAGISFCFDEDTPVTMADGSEKPIKSVEPGDVVAGGGEVLGVYRLANNTDMYLLGDTIVSGNHYVRGPNGWCEVSEYPGAVLISGYTKPVIWCLKTAGNRIVIRGVEYADYEESVNDVQWMNRRINESLGVRDDSGLDLEEGWTPTTEIPMEMEGVKKNICDLKVGDVLAAGVRVIGVYRGYVDDEDVYQYKRQMGMGGSIVEADGERYSRLHSTGRYMGKYTGEVYNIFTDMGFWLMSDGSIVRDYTETRDAECHREIQEHCLRSLKMADGEEVTIN